LLLKNILAKEEISKRQKSVFLENWKISDFEPTSAAGELKRGECADLVREYDKILRSPKILLQKLFLALFGRIKLFAIFVL
jgi:hypothetical protein